MAVSDSPRAALLFDVCVRAHVREREREKVGACMVEDEVRGCMVEDEVISERQMRTCVVDMR